MTSDFIVSSKEEFEKVKIWASKVFYENDFPEKIFRNGEWQLMLMESWNIFNESEYDRFVSLIGELNEAEIYLTPNRILAYDVKLYLEGINDNKGHYFPIVKFFSDLPFSDFFKMQNKFMYRNATDTFLFSDSCKWGIYNNSNIDLMIIGFSSEIKSTVEKYYNYNEERITSVSVLLEDVETWAKPSRIEAIKDKIVENYGEYFSD